jgi:cysteine desulfurase
MKRIYFDHNATTKIRKEVLDEIMPYLAEEFGNPNSLHFFGQKAHMAVDQARQRVSDFLGAKSDEIVFTGSGTEANNLAITGIAQSLKQGYGHIISSAVEHPSVLNTLKFLEKKGWRITLVPVDRYGIIDPESVKNAISKDTVLITIMLANNEVGTIQPVAEIAETGRSAGIPVHTDAVQAAGKIPVKVRELEVDMLSISGHKICSPKGTGALFIRRGLKIVPLITGGYQEKGLRAGTENVIGITGMGKACELINSELDSDIAVMKKLRDRLEKGILENIRGAAINGHPEKRIANTLNLSFQDMEGEGMGEAILINLDLMGIAVSTGSACSSGAAEPSHVLAAMGLDPSLLRNSIRFSTGIENTEEEADYTIKCLINIIDDLRKMRTV